MSEGFGSFIIRNRNVWQLGIAFLISTQINSLASSFVEGIIDPIVELLLGMKKQHLEELTVTIAGVEFGVGKLLVATVKLLATLFAIYWLLRAAFGHDLQRYQLTGGRLEALAATTPPAATSPE